MGGVFINYRTDDGEWPALLIYQELNRRFGADQVFYASRSIPAGENFAREIERRLVNSDVLLAIIGKRWLETDDTGRRKIDDPDDWVRHEIRTAFAHGLRVIPVLVDDAPLLPKKGIPGDVAELANCQYLRLRHRDRDDHDVAALANDLTRQLPPRAVEPWRVRIRDSWGAVRGAGVLLSDQHVLTAGRVAAGAGGEVAVEFIGLGDLARARARVVPKWCVLSPGNERRGDIALLQLEHRLPTRVGATLRRTALSWDRDVRVCGFPPGQESGAYTRAILLGSDGLSGEWLPMSAGRPGEHRVRAGFTGAGVVDEGTGLVLGIVVGEYTDGLAWMMPVETVLSHLPYVAEWVAGDVVADDVFSKPAEPGPYDADLARRITEWLDRRDSGDRVLTVVGPQVAQMYRAVLLSSREQRTEVLDPAQETGAVPAVGSIDLAVDVSGKTADEVSRRIFDRAGIPLDPTRRPSEQVRGGVPPMTIVVDGLDEAEQPEALLNDVLRPLAEGECRLVLGFRVESSPSLATVRSWDVGSVGHRLARLVDRTEALEAAERRLMSLRTHVHDPAPVSLDGARLQVALGALRQIAAGPEPDDTRERLERFERNVARALRRAAQLESHLRELLRERADLRGCLVAYKAKAHDEDLTEDVGVAGFYRRAHRLLSGAPTDVPAARQAVSEYLAAIRQAYGSGPGEGRR